MSNYWPKRPDLEGFSIEKLAKSYRAKLSEAESDSKESLMNEKLLKQVESSKINHPKEAIPHRDNVRSLHTTIEQTGVLMNINMQHSVVDLFF